MVTNSIVTSGQLFHKPYIGLWLDKSVCVDAERPYRPFSSYRMQILPLHQLQRIIAVHLQGDCDKCW